ncbi:MAG: hypothetical protein Q9166_002922 [cf. Caloplaca sp. 2 TL-2023]
MRLRIRGPSGQSSITLTDGATVADLHVSILEKTSISDFDLKYGYPPRPLLLDEYNTTSKLSELPIKLEGEQLLVSAKPKGTPSTTVSSEPKARSTQEVQKSVQSSGSEVASDNLKHNPPDSFSFSAVGEAPAPGLLGSPLAPSRNPGQPLSLQRKPNTMGSDPPEIHLTSHAAKVVLRIMPDDNSCLFRAFGSAFFGIMDNMTELRSIIASYIQEHKEEYSEVVLEKPPDDYCRWIQTEDAWGGAIELNVLSRHFDIEICSVDVQTLRVDRFNEGMSKRCILVYSGIHYDTIALSQSDPYATGGYTLPEEDLKIFDPADDALLAAAVELCAELQKRHYFTDTAGFQVKCNVCKKTFVGEKGATEHASVTGHYNFGEAG